MSNRSIQSAPIRVLIVDDMRTIRALIRAMLSSAPDIEVIGEAGDPYEAREMIRTLDPDVIRLDVEMPRMDGLSLLERITRFRPMPFVMVSSRTPDKSFEAVRALSLGAVECVDVARLGKFDDTGACLADIVRMAASSQPQATRRLAAQRTGASSPSFAWNGKAVLIGASKRGVDALLAVFSDHRADGPPTVIAQHMPASSLESFIARLDRSTLPRVVKATDELVPRPGMVGVCPGGDKNVSLSRANTLRIECVPETGREADVPPIDILFSSAESHIDKVVGLVLTGMERDGAESLVRLCRRGAHTIVQDGATAVVDGMPRASRELDAAAEVPPLAEIGARILASASYKQTAMT